jgi:thiol-disulfide isomerase/thioredoxin/outer membrane protein assembly factor BamD (BamD/ComL family)
MLHFENSKVPDSCRLSFLAIRMALLVCLLLSAGPFSLLRSTATGSAKANAPGQEKEATFDAEFQKGIQNLRRRRFEEALKSFKRANEMRDKKSPECYVAMAQAYMGLEAHKNVIESCDKALELGGNDPQVLVPAYNLKGLALHAQAEGKNQKKLQEAEAVFRQGLAIGTDVVPMIHYNLGTVLMQQDRDPEGIAEMQKFLELEPKGFNAESARKMMENPRRAREPYAPDFSFTTADGEFVTLEELRGKIVVLDFWGTWCPPCVASVPAMRGLHKKYSKDPAFVLIGIDTRDDEETLRAFTAENKMTWRQYRDQDNQVSLSFSIRAFPTYVVIDPEGILRYRGTGATSRQEAALDDAIRKQLKLLTRPPGAN